MLAPLLLAAAVSASPVDAWAEKTCPMPPTAGSSVDSYQLREKRLACLRDAMNRELDRIIVPLAKKDPAEKQRWMKLQADFNHFTKELCGLAEDVAWIDLNSGAQTEGSGGGWTALDCEERTVSWRALYAISAQHGPEVLAKFLRSSAADGTDRRANFQERFETLTELGSKGPHPSQPSDDGRVLTKRDWEALHKRYEQLLVRISKLVDEQCAVSRAALAQDCSETMFDAFFSLVRLDWASDE